MNDPLIGREYNGYRITSRIAEGGMGVIYIGEHLKLGRKAAIKLLKQEYCRDESVVQRFYQEAQAVNAIRNDGIVDIYDFGRDSEGRVFYIMELLEGEPLSRRLSRGALGWPEAVPIINGAVRALAAAHEKGFVHRDLKPDNIWLTYDPFDGHVKVKLLDFGIAKLVGGMESPKDKLTRTGSIIGTPHYMAPEQINGSPDVDQRTDVYAFGVILYEMLSGQTPFGGDTLGAVLMAHLLNEPPHLSTLVPAQQVPPWVPRVVSRMMAKEAGARPPTILHALSELEGGATQVTAPQPVQRPRGGKKRRWPLAVAGIVVLGGAGAAAAVLLRGKGTEEPVVLTPAGAPDAATVAAAARPDAAAGVAAPAPIDYEKLRADAQALLRGTMRDPEPAIRAIGADALGETRDTASVKPLVGLAGDDPDAEVRGRAAGAVGKIGAGPEVKAEFRALEKTAPPPLKVWLAEALLRLGDAPARKRLVEYAGSDDLAVAFKAALALADASPAGDKDAIRALTALAAREAELAAIAPYSGAILLTKLGRLRVDRARALLLAALEGSDERARLAAAEGLARLGDDSAQKVLLGILNDEASPNRLVAANILLVLGDFSGYPLLKTRVTDTDAGARRLVARSLGVIGEKESLPLLGDRLADADPTVRIAAASALLAIVGLDPRLLARASVDWARGALASEDWATREGAAALVGDVGEKEGVVLLAQALADPQPEVRRAAARSAKRLRGAPAARALAGAAKAEKDAATKEQLVRALWTLKEPETKDVLVGIAAEDGRAGVLAAGALVALGDASATPKVEAAAKDAAPEIRLAAVDAAKEANLLPTIVSVLGDTVFEVRFLAAETLAGLKSPTPQALDVLKEALGSEDASLRARATAALLRSGASVEGITLAAPAELLAAPERETRLAALTVVAASPIKDALPLLRRALFDAELDVRRRALEVLAERAGEDKDGATALAKAALRDPEDVVRAEAQALLARLVDEFLPESALVDLAALDAAAAEAQAAHEDARAAVTASEACAEQVAKATTGDPDEKKLEAAEQAATACEAAALGAAAAQARADNALARAVSAAGDAPTGKPGATVEAVRAAAADTTKLAAVARSNADTAVKKARAFVSAEAGDATTHLAAAEAALAAGKLAAARADLDKAQKLLKAKGRDTTALRYTYGELFDRMAARESKPAARKKLLEQARDAYRDFGRKGSGARAAAARARVEEIDGEIAELEGRTP